MSSARRRRRKQRRYRTAVPFRISVPFAPVLGARLWGSGWHTSKLASTLLIGAMAVLLFTMSDSYSFFVYEATIEGNSILTAEQIYASGGAHEQSIFWLQPEAISARIQDDPYVKWADVHCRLPGQLLIEVAERSPRIAWTSPAGERWIDAEGSTLPALTQHRPPILLVDDRGRAAGEDGALQKGIADSILFLAQVFPQVTQFRYDATWGILFQSEHGWSVALGDSTRMKYKASVLATTERQILERGDQPQLVDIRFPDSPYYR